MSQNLSGLKAAIKLLTDAAKDGLASAEGGKLDLLKFGDLPGDLMALIPQLGDIPAEIGSMSYADGVALLESLVADMGLSSAHAQNVANAAFKLLNDLVGVVVPDAMSLAQAIKGQ